MSSPDSTPIFPKGSRDIISSTADMMSGIQYKLILFIFFTFILVSSDMFIIRILSGIPNAVHAKEPTNYGIILQGIFLCLIVIAIDGLINQKVL